MAGEHGARRPRVEIGMGKPICHEGQVERRAQSRVRRVRRDGSQLADNLTAWDGEEDSVKEEHAALIEETREAVDGKE